MVLREKMERQGRWLFRWRSYWPLSILPFLALALRNSEYLERFFGVFYDNIWELVCVGISLIGVMTRCFVAGFVPRGTSGRNTKEQAADTLNIQGMYSIVSHPLYLGNFTIVLGMLLFVQVGWFAVAGIFIFWIYYERIIFAEEEFLRRKFGDVFLTWAREVPAFFPNPGCWKSPMLSFSFKTVLRREFSTFFAVIFFLLF